jgi:predicted permease
MEALLQDIRYALRGLRRSPGHALVAVLTIGLGVGVNTTVFTWMQALVLHPFPQVERADRLVSLFTRPPTVEADWTISYAGYRDWADGSRAFEGIAVFNFEQLGLRLNGPPERVWSQLVSANYFDVLGVRPEIGRGFLPDEERAAAPVAVISHGLWRRSFGGDSGVVGQRVMLNGTDVTIVGVAPERFAGVTPALAFDVWLPVTLQPVLMPVRHSRIDQRGDRWLQAVARLRAGVSLEQAREDLAALQSRIAETYPEERGFGSKVVRLRDAGPSAQLVPLLSALLGVTGLVLLIACANLASLLLARASGRMREIGIRLAVGAGRGRLVRQLLTESVVLSLAGGASGVLFALWARDAIRPLLPGEALPLALDFGLDSRVLLFALTVALLTSLVFGLVPALRASRPDLVFALKSVAGRGPRGRFRAQGALVAGEVALCLVSLVCAGLFVRGLQRAQRVDPGFRDPEGVLLVATDFALAGHRDSVGQALADRLLAQVRALPAVSSASLASIVPLGWRGGESDRTTVEGYTPQPRENMVIAFNNVGSDYFATLGIPLLQGRGIERTDGRSALPVAVVNEAFARRYFAGASPLGRRVRQDGQDMTVVGVAANGKYVSLAEAPTPLVYRPYAQHYEPYLTLHLRVAGDPRRLERALRGVFERTDPSLPVLDVRTMAAQMGLATLFQRVGAWMLTAFGALAMGLAAVGVYGVLSHAVAQRTREIGIRVAVGASRRDVLALVVGHAMRPTLVGLAVGAVLAAGAGRLLRSQIFGVSPLDTVTFGGVIALLAFVALLAAWLPARRAARVDPVVALQAE